MGYCSDIKMVITTEKPFGFIKNDVVKLIKDIRKEEDKQYEIWRKKGWGTMSEADIHCVSNAFKIHSDNLITFEIRDVKWYDTYPDVQLFNAFKDKLTKICNEKVTNENVGFHFVRLGEESDDIEEVIAGNPKHLISIVRDISFSPSLDEEIKDIELEKYKKRVKTIKTKDGIVR